MIDNFRGCLIGLATGDAVGTTVEFKPRGSFPPVTDMVGGGPFELNAGEWTDDTSMALCLGASLLECGEFDAKDQQDKYFRWYMSGYMSSNGRCFDIGNTTRYGVIKAQQTGDPYNGLTAKEYAGNGCIMRLAPIPMFFFNSPQCVDTYARLSSRTTHGSQDCLDSTGLFSSILVRALNGESKEQILFDNDNVHPLSGKVQSIANGEYRDKSIDDIKGSGYVVESLEASLWCFLNTDNFRDAILMATNLGDDADTTAAITGQVAGAYYGLRAIPLGWLAKLAHGDMIVRMAEDLYERGKETYNEDTI